ncbi:MAG: efflux RND transporter periplasmic adaptor subunit [Gammaproteobacteria bacterium]|nr:efflux RND transporter periplasmic adaptor subunit [Gammaproteobacteria bacterium]MBU1415962.1 efflux RND transporter periplasmic adaptor subunit [Gammaproteobacteria bacterium]
MKLPKLIAPAALTLMLVACGQGQEGAQGAGGPGAMPPAEVDVLTVAPGSAVLTRELPGRLQAVRTAQVRARVEGVVEKRLFAEGSDVKAGTSLFRLDARTYQAAAAAAEADLAVARQTVERFRPLLEMKAVSQQEFDLAEAKQKQAEAALAKARLDLENSTVPAPISGRIGRALVTEGALVGRGDATLLATIEQLDPIYANFTQSNADLLRLQQAIKGGRLKKAAGAKVELLLEDGSVYGVPGRLTFSDLAVDPNTGSIQMRAEFPNPKRELLPGTFVRVRFPEAVIDGAITLPQRAVTMSPQGESVMTVDAESKVVPRPVKLGGMAGGDWIVQDGLKAGDKVIVNGLQKARPGSVVKPVPWPPAETSMPAPAPKS